LTYRWQVSGDFSVTAYPNRVKAGAAVLRPYKNGGVLKRQGVHCPK
jgi:hypothetical protein